MMNIKRWVLEGEGLTMDFKKTINNCAKIAKTLVAYANNKGGRLLIGVADNGDIKGVKSEEEEKYMILKAAQEYCRPVIAPKFHEVSVDDRTVLVAEIFESKEKPHYAKDEQGKWWVYVRVDDKSRLASKIVVDVLTKQKEDHELIWEYTDKEKSLLEYLETHDRITLSEICKLLNANRKKTSRMLVNLILLGLVKSTLSGNVEYYSTVGFTRK